MGLRQSYLETIKSVYRQEGPIGFYRGCIPPFFGSVIYRSVQFSAFELFFTLWKDNESLCKPIPGAFGIEWRTLFAGFLAGSARSFIECPFEYAKVNRQVGGTWYMKSIYKGLTEQYFRSTFMMTLYFCQVDLFRRHTNFFDHKLGQFFASGWSACFGFFLIWPLEVLKNLNQAGTKGVGNSITERARHILKT